MALSTFALWYNHRHHLSPELFHFPQPKLPPLDTNSPFCPTPAPGNRHSFPLYEFDYSGCLILVDSVFIFLCLVYLTWCDDLLRGPRLTLPVAAIRGHAPRPKTCTHPAQVRLVDVAVGCGGRLRLADMASPRWLARHSVPDQLTVPPHPQFRAELLGEG